MTVKPTVSIIIPCFNDGLYLPEAIASARAQTFPDKEIIVINDHSNDRATLDVLSKFSQEPDIVVLETSGGKKGLPATRNTGISVAKGKYILPLDSDDKIGPTFIEKAVHVLEMRPDITVCDCKAKFFGLKHGSCTMPDWSWETMVTRNCIFATAVYRKADWERVGGYDEDLVLGMEDYAFWLKILDGGGKAYRIDETLFFYRIKPHSMIAKVADDERHAKAAAGLFNSCQEIFIRNADILHGAIHKLHKDNSKFTCLFSWKLLQPVFKFEWCLRQILKKLLGRV